MTMRRFSLVAAALVLAAACHREQRSATNGYDTTSSKPAATAKKASAPAAAPHATEVGDTMPAYSSAMLDGKPLDLAAEQKGKVVLLNVWATWCGPCRGEIPTLRKLNETYHPRGFEVLGVSVDEAGSDAVKQFVTEQKIDYPIAVDADGKIANLLQTTVLPTSVLIDRNGKIVWRQIGAIDENDPALKDAVEKALSAS